MRVPVALRIFLVHLVFTVGAGVAAFLLVRHQFDEYAADWQQRVATLPSEQLLEPLASEVGRSLLLRLESYPEVQDRDRDRIVYGLNAVLREIRSVRGLFIVDQEQRIQYSKDTADIDLVLRQEWQRDLFGSDVTVRRTVPAEAGESVTAVMVPIFEGAAASAAGSRRLGSLLVVYQADPALVARLPRAIRPPRLEPRDYAMPLLVFIGAVVLGGAFLGLLTSLPVRRLDRALIDFRDRGFRGRIDAEKARLGSELDGAVSAINELGGRLEAMDSKGREREALLATLAQSLEEGMIALDPHGVPVAWNEAASRLLVPDAGGADLEPTLRAAVERADGLIGPHSDGLSVREIELEGPEGEVIPIRVTEVPFEMGPGRSGTLLLLRDLATLRKVETHLLEAGRFAVLAHLAGSLAHEIRNPLHSIGLNAGVLEQYVGHSPAASTSRAFGESLRSIQHETRRLTDLLNNYLGMLRSSPEPASVDIRDICRRVIHLLGHAALKAHVDIRLEGDEDIPTVSGIPDRLQQAVLNLVLNAIQAMPSGGTVSLRTASVGGVVRLTVADTGPGLPPGLEEHLFDTRVTTKPGGSGLGLPLVRLIAESHGGSVWYRSDPGRGASFTMVLPAETPVAA